MYKTYLFCLLASCSLVAKSNIEPYVTVGGGAVFPTKNSSTTAASNLIDYTPTIPGYSLFTLPQVVWRNEYQTGYEINASLGLNLACAWCIESEFLYQNMERKISGEYVWQEIDALNVALFAEQSGNPIQLASTEAKTYSMLSNILYDWRGYGSNWSLSFGGGAGVAWLKSDSTFRGNFLVIQTSVPPLNLVSPTSEYSPRLYGTAFAWQVKVGLNYQFMRNVNLGINYRLFGTTQFRSGNSYIITNPNSSFDAVFKLPRSDLRGFLNNSVNATLIYKF